MKNSIRISKVVLLTVIYCLTIGMGTSSLMHPDIQTNKQEKNFSTIVTILSPYTPQSEGSVTNYTNFTASSFENLFDGLWAIIKTTEQFYKTVFSQYTSFSINFLIKHRKTDIIFPSHYFW